MALITELAEGWIFYSAYYQLPEKENALSLSQAVDLLVKMYSKE